MKILIVDDDGLTRGSLSRLIKSCFETCELQTAENGEEALMAMESFCPDLVITDLNMPQMDGLTLIKQIRQSGNQVVIVMMSSDVHFDIAETAVEAGVNHFISKTDGQSIERLVAVIEELEPDG